MDTRVITIADIKQEITPFKTPLGEEVRSVKIVDTDNLKYRFYSYRNGTDDVTKAYLNFKSANMVKGMQVTINYNELDKEFTNKEGKLIKYKDRFVAFFTGEPVISVDSPLTPPPPVAQSYVSTVAEQPSYTPPADDINVDDIIPF